MSRLTGRRAGSRAVALALAIVAVAVMAGCRGPDNGQNTLKPKGEAAQKIDNLFVPVFIASAVVGVLVLAGVLWVALRYRHRPGSDDNPKQIHGSTPLEIGWTIVPALILAVVAVFTIRAIFDLAEEPKGDVLNVTSVGKQWWWEFEYDDEGVVTANELVIPVGRDVRVELTACSDSLPGECNVIHSFWVPELAGKQDVVPGRTQHTVLHANEPGEYLGQCAEYCGLSHANMRFRVFAVEPDEYEQWLEDQQEGPAVPLSEPAPPEPGAPPLPEGQEPPTQPAGPAQELIGKYACTNCHTFEDPAASTYGPNLTHLASRTTFASGYFELTRENLIEWLLDAPSMIPMESADCREEGAPGDPNITCVGMPSFTEDTPEGQPVMTRQEAEEIADYLLSLT